MNHEDDFDCCRYAYRPRCRPLPVTKFVTVLNPDPLQFHNHVASPFAVAPGVQHQHGGMHPHTHNEGGTVTFAVPA
jgi:hypothetical protein